MADPPPERDPPGGERDSPGGERDPLGGERDSPGGERDSPGGEREPGEIPARLVVVAYALALVCAVAPLAVLGAGFAGAVLFTRGRRGAGLGVIAAAVLCSALGIVLLR